MNFFIGISVVIIFFCLVIYFQHTVVFGQGRRDKNCEINEGHKFSRK